MSLAAATHRLDDAVNTLETNIAHRLASVHQEREQMRHERDQWRAQAHHLRATLETVRAEVDALIAQITPQQAG